MKVVDAYPLTDLLTPMPGTGVRAVARILTEVIGKDFASIAHLASDAGIAPVTGQSGTCSRGQSPSLRSNKVLKRALVCLPLLRAKPTPPAGTNHDKKRAETKRYNKSVIALAQHNLFP
ncbi:transposase [Auritidibacter ignavus]|uniref:transposase n=1 Tax=Auritidibacter ignavus TaxID=678932 RepID=UPI00109CB887|nr:transposase [Auritidibacter ignavus]WHS35733.1 transposase [Auritidibacter ignavus]